MENIRLAFQGIWGHKMRSFLTMLGIIIGIASIITIVSTIKGTNEQIKQNLIGAGGNVVNVQLYEGTAPFDSANGTTPSGVRMIDYSAKREIESLDGVAQAALYTNREWSDNVSAGRNQFSGTVYGVDPDYLNVLNYSLTYGRMFHAGDYDHFHKVVILDQKAASVLFPGIDPIGQVVDIKGQPFTVVGVVKKSTQFTPNIQSMEDYLLYADNGGGAVFLTSAAWPVAYRFDEPQSVAIRAESTDHMAKAGKAAADYLTETQLSDSVKAQPGQEEAQPSDEMTEGESVSSNTVGSSYSYQSEDLLQQAQQLQEMSNSTNQQLIWIASISLLVGGIGVMNIMLVSVTERTGEIGLKKALGAKKNRIRVQFLTEASVLTSLGGVIGVALGILLAQLISKTNQIPVAISVPAILVSVVFSMAIGVVFGLLPAMKAANLSPIEALRRD